MRFDGVFAIQHPKDEAMMRHYLRSAIVLSALTLGVTLVVEIRIADAAPTNDGNSDTASAVTERADKIVAPLGIDDPGKVARVRGAIVNQIVGLRAIYDARDAKIAQAQNSPGDKAVAEAWRGLAQKEADLRLYRLHRQFVARLEAELTPTQLNQVKDGMTDDLMPNILNRYLEQLPDLPAQQQADVRADLLEAREYAMDADSPEDRRAWFGKFQNRIDGRLAAAGYDVKQPMSDTPQR